MFDGDGMMNLKEKPFYLNDSQVQFIEQKIKHMSVDEKIGQLFCPINYIEDEDELRKFVRRFQPGGLMNRPGPAKNVQKNIGSCRRNPQSRFLFLRI